MAECDTRASAFLKLGIGVLNPGLVGESTTRPKMDLSSIDVYGYQAVCNTEALKSTKWRDAGVIYAILLKIINPDGPDAECGESDIVNAACTADNNPAPKLNYYVVRIPEMHCFDVPKNLENPCELDEKWISAHRQLGGLAQAANREAQDKPVKVGQPVEVQYVSKNNLTELKYLGPTDRSFGIETLPQPDGDGSPPSDYGKLLEECIKLYPNKGATGDLIGSDKNLWKSNSGIPPVVSGLGIPDGPILIGETHKEWVVKLFRSLKEEGKYKGVIWTGVCQNNGPMDDLAMLSNDGKKTSPRTTGATVGKGFRGRSTVIYMPIGTDPTQPLEIIYWFHDALGFKNSPKEWNMLWKSLKDMIKKKKTLGDSRRNFVLVVPEMLWSQQGSAHEGGIPRNKTNAITLSPGETEIELAMRKAGYTDRQWAAWGFQGPRETETFGPYPKQGGASDPYIPYSFQATPTPVDTSTARTIVGNMKLLHNEVVDLLQKHFSVIDKGNIAYITLMASGKGGIAISNLARLGHLGTANNQLNPSRIVLMHADYSSASVVKLDTGIFGATGLKASNFFGDNDAYEIIKNISKDTQLEIHVSWASDAPKLPTQAAGAFIGALSRTTRLINQLTDKTFNNAVERLRKWGTGHWLFSKDTIVTTSEESAALASIKSRTQRDYITGYSFLKRKQTSTIRMAPPFDNIIYKGWGNNSAQGAMSWIPATQNIPIKGAIQQTTKEIPNIIDAGSEISFNTKKVFKKFNGRVILYKSELVGESKTVAILEPYGASAYNNYELIYYLHGDIGMNGAAKTYNKSLENQFQLMVEDGRNVIIVLMDIDPHPSSPSSQLWADPDKPESTFNNFHEEILNKMDDKWSLSIGGGGMADAWDALVPVDTPSFFTIKAHGGGSRMLKHAVKNMNSKYLSGTGKNRLQRIDLYDANWGPDLAIVNMLKTKQQIALGENFEIQLIATSKPIGDDKVPAQSQAAKYLSGGDASTNGVWVLNSAASHGILPYRYFSAPTKLNFGIPQVPVPGETPQNAIDSSPPGTGIEAPMPLVFDQEGKAYGPPGPPYYGKAIPKYDLKLTSFYKGRLANHTPSTGEMDKTGNCQVGSRQIKYTTKTPVLDVFSTTQNCKTNPLGLLQYNTSKFTNIVIDPVRKGFSWGSIEAGKYLKGIDDAMWTKTSPRTTWVVKDLSPENANGVDRVSSTHSSHREGIDLDINLPKIDTTGEAPTPTAKPTLEILKAQELDVDKTLAFMILSKLHGAAVIFLDKKFFKPLRERANFIATDGFTATTPGSVLATDQALKPFFKEHLYGKPNFAKELVQLLQHKRRHEDHFQVRVLRKWGSHETRDYPGWAMKRLKKMGCDYKGL